jgi:hypothetical protein
MTVPSIVLSNGVSMPAIAAGTWEYDQNTAQAAIEAGTFSSPSLFFFLYSFYSAVFFLFFFFFYSFYYIYVTFFVFCIFFSFLLFFYVFL